MLDAAFGVFGQALPRELEASSIRAQFLRGASTCTRFHSNADQLGYFSGGLTSFWGDKIFIAEYSKLPFPKYGIPALNLSFACQYYAEKESQAEIESRRWVYAVRSQQSTNFPEWEQTKSIIMNPDNFANFMIANRRVARENRDAYEADNRKAIAGLKALIEELSSRWGSNSSNSSANSSNSSTVSSGAAAFSVVKRWSGGVNGVREQSYVRCDTGRKRGDEFKAWLHDSGYWSSPGNTGTYKTLQEVASSICN